MTNFVNLHNHSHFSILDGLGKPEEYVARAAELDQPAVALTDHGSLSGLYSLWKACKGTGVKPIAGCEFYIAPESRHHKKAVRWGTEDQRGRDLSRGGAYGHITILATSVEGVRSLYRLQELAYAEGFYAKPRIDLAALNDHREGLICLTGCASSLLATRLRLEQHQKAVDHLSELKDIFSDKLWVELMHHGISDDHLDETTLNHGLVEVARKLGVSTVATNDAHYCNRSDSDVHTALLCLQTNSKLTNPKFSFTGNSYHIASFDEMAANFATNRLPPEAIRESCLIADLVGSYDDIFKHQLRMPKSKYNNSEEWSNGIGAENTALATLAIQGLRRRKPDYDSEYAKRLEYEVDTIASLGFADYFLVLMDICEEARRSGIRIGPGRGSAGGSLVAYALGITDLDPLSFGLLFERFLNPERVGLPDIDIDIQEDRRDDVLEIARQKHGEVAEIGTYQTVGAKQALKDAARVLDYPYSVGEERTSYVARQLHGRRATLADYTGPQDDIYDLAVGLEGTVRAESVHASAVVVSPVPLADAVPLRRTESGTSYPVVALDMNEVEEIGFIKQDYLGLRTLKVIDDCLKMPGVLHAIESRRGGVGAQSQDGLSVALPTSSAECDDLATYNLLAAGSTLGVFQLDSDGMRRVLRDVRPESFGDIASVLALYRPGPMGAGADRSYAARKAGREGVAYPHPDLAEALAPALAETHGLIVFQEQVLEVLAAVGGYTYGSAELIFNAMRKKQHDKMAAAKPDFIRRLSQNGYEDDAIQALWDTLVPFADYSFGKAHSTGYALVAYWTAYLKANHPAEYMAALLTNQPNNSEKAKRVFRSYLNEVTEMGIDLLPPDINESGSSFTPTPEGLRYGLAAIKGVGNKVVDNVIKNRPYTSLTDFYGRAPAGALNSGILGALVRSGAMDKLASREGHADRYEDLAEKARTERKARQSGQRGVVRPTYRSPKKPVDFKQRQKWERDTLGVALSVPDVIVRPITPLDANAMEWLRRTLESYPGRQRAYLDFGFGKHINTGCRVDGVRVVAALKPLGVDVDHSPPR